MNLRFDRDRFGAFVARQCGPSLQILLMTGFPSCEIRDEANRAQVFRFLEKPFGLTEVADAIAAACD